MEMELSLICPMDVAAFPFDSHTCVLKFSSFARLTLESFGIHMFLFLLQEK